MSNKAYDIFYSIFNNLNQELRECEDLEEAKDIYNFYLQELGEKSYSSKESLSQLRTSYINTLARIKGTSKGRKRKS
jgi:hypothetical protein